MQDLIFNFNLNFLVRILNPIYDHFINFSLIKNTFCIVALYFFNLQPALLHRHTTHSRKMHSLILLSVSQFQKSPLTAKFLLSEVEQNFYF